MSKIDITLAVLAVLGMVAFNMIMVFFVKDLALSLVIIVGLCMMAFDFWRSYSATRQRR